MEETKNQEVQQPTAEELKNYCNQLLQQRNQLAQQLGQIQNVLNKLPWLFKVIEYAEQFEEEFVTECKREIKVILTPPTEETETE